MIKKDKTVELNVVSLMLLTQELTRLAGILSCYEDLDGSVDVLNSSIYFLNNNLIQQDE